MSALSIATLVCAALGFVFLLAALGAARQHRLARTLARFALALGFFAVGTLLALVSLGLNGYQALTHEELAATVRVEPAGAQRFRAQVRYPDGREANYLLSGDELYVDAHILKWTPLASRLGLHTVYRLDRIAGRYASVADERERPRTVEALSETPIPDLFGLRRRYAFLAPLLDAEYGSATFAPADVAAELELRVSTTGLLFRPAAPGP